MMKPRLVGISGSAAGRAFELGEGEATLGRDAGCAIVLSDNRVSRRHALIRREGARFRIDDCGSRHGTRVNGASTTSAWLDHGDRVEVGSSVLELQLEADGPDEAPGPERPGAPASTPAGSPLRETETVSTSTLELDLGEAFLLSAPRVAAHPEGTRVARDLAALLSITTELGAALDLEAAERRLLERLAEVVPAERAALCRVRGGAGAAPGEGGGQASGDHGNASDGGRGSAVDFASVTAWTRSAASDDRLPLSRTIARKVLRDRVGLLANGVLEDEGLTHAVSLHEAQVHSVLCVPLVARGRLLGVLYLDSSNLGGAFDAGHLQFVAAVSVTAALALDTAWRVERLEAENRRLVEDVVARHGMVGDAPRMRELWARISKAAAADSTVLVRGESGTGKELVAHAIHAASRRAQGPFVAINCAAIPDTLLESELLGHEKGAFTGAVARKPGKIELADGGTLFLDEMGDLPLLLQAKLLRVLTHQGFERVGGTQPVRVDVRIVAATHVDLEKAVKDGRFRQDLYYRLNVVTLTLPALRERREDVPRLARHFAERLAAREGRRPPILTQAAEDRLVAYAWPGNVRELENAIERAIVLGSGDEIGLEDLPETLLESAAAPADAGAPPSTLDYHERLNDAKRLIVREALEASGGVVTVAARRLGLNITYLHRLMNNLGLRS